MKTFNKLLIILVILFIGIKPVFSLCDYKEKANLNEEVSYIKFNYEIVTRTCSNEDNWCNYPEESEAGPIWSFNIPSFKISLLNVNDKFDIKIEKSVLKQGGVDPDATEKLEDKEREYYGSSAVGGVITFNDEDMESIKQYKIEIKSSNQTNCPGELLRVMHKKTPRINFFSGRGICLDHKHLPECEEYTFLTNIDIDDVNKAIAKETRNTKQTEDKKSSIVFPITLISTSAILIVVTILILRRKVK